ncbi:hypothetical protein [Mycoplasma suis]|uniref:Uncharacterized protein n=2 Tax=Mycoplasma suis TaxID=57372 RepID=F0QQW1_MYCSL|nr:hypothetical protein [Mycoplasma suis]ADX97881.1 hypothetical protein MSU_0339 [Mycoplasma suis str. Illinois]CBZ40381.1 hypothetical protein MSUIS_02880 [Mycoplasma suis KI3806]
MLKNLLSSVFLLTTGAASSGTISFFSKDRRRNRNSNNISIFKQKEDGKIFVGNGEREDIKRERGNLKMVGTKENKWQYINAEDKDLKNQTLFWLLGKVEDPIWWNFFISQESFWILESNNRNRLANNTWGNMLKSNSNSYFEDKKQTSEIFLEGIQCKELQDAINKSKEKLKWQLQGEKNNFPIIFSGTEKSTISLSCEDKSSVLI